MKVFTNTQVLNCIGEDSTKGLDCSCRSYSVGFCTKHKASKDMKTTCKMTFMATYLVQKLICEEKKNIKRKASFLVCSIWVYDDNGA